MNDTDEEVRAKVWSYEAPTAPFRDIKGYLSFYASSVPWECLVDDEKVQPQEGNVGYQSLGPEATPALLSITLREKYSLIWDPTLLSR